MTYTPNIGRPAAQRSDVMGEVRRIAKPRRASCALGTCRHEGHWRDRAIVSAPCSRCGEPIGFNTPYVDQTPDEEFASPVYTHASCVLPQGSAFA